MHLHKSFKLLALVLVVGLAGSLLSACQLGGQTTPAQTTTSAPTTPTLGSDTGNQLSATTVTIQSMAFTPQNLQVKVGQTVTWTNQDQPTHTIASDTGAFDSSNVATGGTFSFTFTKAGTYPYHCSIHPSMKAQVTVTQ